MSFCGRSRGAVAVELMKTSLPDEVLSIFTSLCVLFYLFIMLRQPEPDVCCILFPILLTCTHIASYVLWDHLMMSGWFIWGGVVKITAIAFLCACLLMANQKLAKLSSRITTTEKFLNHLLVMNSIAFNLAWMFMEATGHFTSAMLLRVGGGIREACFIHLAGLMACAIIFICIKHVCFPEKLRYTFGGYIFIFMWACGLYKMLFIQSSIPWFVMVVAGGTAVASLSLIICSCAMCSSLFIIELLPDEVETEEPDQDKGILHV